MSKLHDRLPSNLSDKLESQIQKNAVVSSSLREEVAKLQESIRDYQHTQSSSTMEIVTTVTNATSQESKSISEIKQQLDRMPEELYRHLETLLSTPRIVSTHGTSGQPTKALPATTQAPGTILIAQSIASSLDCKKTLPSQNLPANKLASREAVSELKATFCKW